MDFIDLGMKQTKTRKIILNILENSFDALSALDIYKKILDDEINLSTVYRTLSAFYEKGVITKEIRQDGQAIYSLKKENHHHVIVCTKCNNRVYLKTCPFKMFDREIYKETGFILANHNMEIYGICPSCQKK